VNDQRQDDQHRSYDILLRSILTLPAAPAIISMEFFAIAPAMPMVLGGSNQVSASSPSLLPSFLIFFAARG